MSYSGDAAEQVVRMSLETGEVAVRLAGSGAKQLAVLIYAILREQKKTAGKARLTNMLRSGKELKVFAVKDSDLKLFCREAKKVRRPLLCIEGPGRHGWTDRHHGEGGGRRQDQPHH